MTISWTLFRYLTLRFMIGVAIIGGSLTALVFLIDLVELLRNFSDESDMGFTSILGLGLLKIPHLMSQVLPFIFLFGALFSFTQLTRSNELVVVRAAGVSVWQFLAPAILFTFLFGIFVITIYNPVASTFYSRYEAINSRYSTNSASLLEVSEDGLWLRQGTLESQSVIHALTAQNRATLLEDVIIFTYQGTDKWAGRIDADTAVLEDGFWHISEAQVTQRGDPPVFHESYLLKTTLTQSQIQDSFASPDTISFWNLGSFIERAEAAGFSATRHRLHWHQVLSIPFLLCAMVLIAASFSLRLTRLGGIGRLVGAGVLFGFGLYFFSDVTNALGVAGNLPAFLAAWAPTFIALLLGGATLLYLEDG